MHRKERGFTSRPTGGSDLSSTILKEKSDSGRSLSLSETRSLRLYHRETQARKENGRRVSMAQVQPSVDSKIFLLFSHVQT